MLQLKSNASSRHILERSFFEAKRVKLYSNDDTGIWSECNVQKCIIYPYVYYIYLERLSQVHCTDCCCSIYRLSPMQKGHCYCQECRIHHHTRIVLGEIYTVIHPYVHPVKYPLQQQQQQQLIFLIPVLPRSFLNLLHFETVMNAVHQD
jgi:hypothetical protein